MILSRSGFREATMMDAFKFPKGDSLIFTTATFQFIVSPKGVRSVCIGCDREMVSQGQRNGKWFICPQCGKRSCSGSVTGTHPKVHPSVTSEILRKRRRDLGRVKAEEKFGDRPCCSDTSNRYFDRFLESWRCGTCHFLQPEVVT